MDAKLTDASLAYTQAMRRAADIKPGQFDDPTEKASGGPNFAAMVEEVVQTTLDAGRNSEQTAMKAMVNEAEITDVVTAVANAEMTLETLIAVRDRVIGAYQDIMKMPI